MYKSPRLDEIVHFMKSYQVRGKKVKKSGFHWKPLFSFSEIFTNFTKWILKFDIV